MIVASGDEERELTLSERIERWLLGAPGVAYLLSMLFHASLLVGFALVVSRMLPNENERGTILIEPQESEEISLDEVDMAVELAPVKVDPLPAQLREVPVVEAEVPVPLPDDILTELPKVGGEGTGEAGGEGLARPKTKNAVTKGSFTAWTIPE
ncbi:MAG: hypothetical protein KY476_16680, partial [Planctomycetes bacterium]|nr:hypothetical protein [Planctomycetota bacterium]